MIVFSIVFYILFAASLYILGRNAYVASIQGSKKNTILSILLFALIFTIISGLRFRVGEDCESYAKVYQSALDGWTISNTEEIANPESGFLFLMNICSSLHLPRFVFMSILAMMEIVCLLLALRNRLFLLPFIGIVIILGPYYLFMMNGMRQIIASCIFCLALYELVEHKRWLLYLAAIFVASLFHRSSLILLPFVFCIFIRRIPNKYVCSLLLISSVIIGHTEFAKAICSSGRDMLALLGYGHYFNTFDFLLENESTVMNYGPRRIATLLSHMIIILFSDKVASRYPKDHFYKCSYILFLIYAVYFELVVSMDVLFIRLVMSFLPCVLITEAYTLSYLRKPDMNGALFKYVKNSRDARSICTLFYLACIFICCSYLLLSCVSEGRSPSETVLYKFFFLHNL